MEQETKGTSKRKTNFTVRTAMTTTNENDPRGIDWQNVSTEGERCDRRRDCDWNPAAPHMSLIDKSVPVEYISKLF